VHLRAHPPAAAVPQLAEARRCAHLIRACIEIVRKSRTLESAKTTPVMQILAIPDAAVPKVKRRI
jgi:hypothetical protein